MGYEHTTTVQGYPWEPCPQCPRRESNGGEGDEGVCPSRRHLVRCKQVLDNPRQYVPIVLKESAENRPGKSRRDGGSAMAAPPHPRFANTVHLPDGSFVTLERLAGDIRRLSRLMGPHDFPSIYDEFDGVDNAVNFEKSIQAITMAASSHAPIGANNAGNYVATEMYLPRSEAEKSTAKIVLNTIGDDTILEWTYANDPMMARAVVDIRALTGIPQNYVLNDASMRSFESWLSECRPMIAARRHAISEVVMPWPERYLTRVGDWLQRHAIAFRSIRSWPEPDPVTADRWDVYAEWVGREALALMAKWVILVDEMEAGIVASQTGELVILPHAVIPRTMRHSGPLQRPQLPPPGSHITLGQESTTLRTRAFQAAVAAARVCPHWRYNPKYKCPSKGDCMIEVYPKGTPVGNASDCVMCVQNGDRERAEKGVLDRRPG
jgi:hypothetical protein